MIIFQENTREFPESISSTGAKAGEIADFEYCTGNFLGSDDLDFSRRSMTRQRFYRNALPRDTLQHARHVPQKESGGAKKHSSSAGGQSIPPPLETALWLERGSGGGWHTIYLSLHFRDRAEL